MICQQRTNLSDVSYLDLSLVESMVETFENVKEEIKPDFLIASPAIHAKLQKPKDDKAYLKKIGADFERAKAEWCVQSFTQTRELAKEFTGRELVNFHSGIKVVDLIDILLT